MPHNYTFSALARQTNLNECCRIVNAGGRAQLLYEDQLLVLTFSPNGVYRHRINPGTHTFAFGPDDRPIIRSIQHEQFDFPTGNASSWNANTSLNETYTVGIDRNDITVNVGGRLWYLMYYEPATRIFERYNSIANNANMHTPFPFRLNRFGEIAIAR